MSNDDVSAKHRHVPLDTRNASVSSTIYTERGRLYSISLRLVMYSGAAYYGFFRTRHSTLRPHSLVRCIRIQAIVGFCFQ